MKSLQPVNVMNVRSAHRGKQRNCNVFTLNLNPLNPAGAKIVAQKVWSVTTPQRIGLESVRKQKINWTWQKCTFTF